MTSPDGFSAVLSGMRSSSESMLGSVGQGTSVVQEVESLVVDVLSFAQIGSTVGAGSTALQGNHVSVLSSLMDGLQQLGQLISQVAGNYEGADQDVSKGFGGDPASPTTGQPATAPTATPTDPTATTPTPTGTAATPAAPTDPVLIAAGSHHYGDTGTDVTTLQNQLNAAGYNVGTADGRWGIATQAALAQYAHDHNLTMPTAPGQLDQRATDSILDAEGNNPNFTQGGRHEIYGIRDGNTGYAGVSAAQQQYGVGSAGERAAAAQVVQNSYDHANLGQFTDPGEQAAIASSIHMRGAGGGTGVQGTSAILHGMAAGTTDANTAATPDDVQAVQNMTPDQFQTAFRSARQDYDISAYGNTTTSHNGTRENWWTAYGHGLQNRYDAEETRFRGLSGN